MVQSCHNLYFKNQRQKQTIMPAGQTSGRTASPRQGTAPPWSPGRPGRLSATARGGPSQSLLVPAHRQTQTFIGAEHGRCGEVLARQGSVFGHLHLTMRIAARRGKRLQRRHGTQSGPGGSAAAPGHPSSGAWGGPAAIAERPAAACPTAARRVHIRRRLNKNLNIFFILKLLIEYLVLNVFSVLDVRTPFTAGRLGRMARL